MIVLSIMNNKGGVSKTVTSINAAAYLSKKNRVLLIDFDAQANSTGATIESSVSHVGEWLTGEKSFQEVVVKYQNQFDVLPSGRPLQTYAKAIGSEDDYQFILKERIEEDKLNERYDCIVIDNAPSLTTLAYTTFIAATHILIPSTAEEFSIAGIPNILQTVANVQKRYNPGLKVVGIFFSKYHSSYRSRIDNDMVAGTKEAYGDLVLNTTIRNNVAIKEAMAYRTPVFAYAPNSAGAEDYEALMEEVITKL
ncbi:ParA family protein [Rufibacter hautae]|uniref:ParA family protein n=1 Tax=Rufibacter hautae TaxID=2595005 RepID=A0A5B6TA88_9BACT|nr:ParA family protein [Rufibacter hautae]KAA3435914.1 ParA family protein [Rufibacter hautae]